MIRIRSAYPAAKPLPAASGARKLARSQHTRELEIDHDERTFTLCISAAGALTGSIIGSGPEAATDKPDRRNSTLILVTGG